MSYIIKCGSVSLIIEESLLQELSPIWKTVTSLRLECTETESREIIIHDFSPDFVTEYFDTVKTKDYDTLVLRHPDEAAVFGDKFELIELIEAVKYRISKSMSFSDIFLYSYPTYSQVIRSGVKGWFETWRNHRNWDTILCGLPDDCFELVVAGGANIPSVLIIKLIERREMSKLKIIKKHQTSRIFVSDVVLRSLFSTKDMEYLKLAEPESELQDDSKITGLVCEIPDEDERPMRPLDPPGPR